MSTGFTISSKVVIKMTIWLNDKKFSFFSLKGCDQNDNDNEIKNWIFKNLVIKMTIWQNDKNIRFSPLKGCDQNDNEIRNWIF